VLKEYLENIFPIFNNMKHYIFYDKLNFFRPLVITIGATRKQFFFGGEGGVQPLTSPPQVHIFSYTNICIPIIVIIVIFLDTYI